MTKYLLDTKLMLALLFCFFAFIPFARGETAGGWVKSPENPVLGGELGVCFDISMLVQPDGGYRMYFSWRTKKSIALTESKDGIHWSAPVIVLAPAGDWEENLNRPGVVCVGGKYHLWYTSIYFPYHHKQ